VQKDRQDWHKNCSVSNLTHFCHSECNEESVRFGIKTISERGLDPSASPQDDSFIHSNKKTGFTLAEVLLTLTIIGIIASLTIPDLITSIQDNQLKAAWKKNYSILNEATLKIIEENGGTMVDALTDYTPMTTAYLEHLNFLKRCSEWVGLGICWHQLGDSYLLNTTIAASTNSSGAILSDGTLIQFQYLSANCSTSLGSLNDICGEIRIDVNGFKGPNTYGKDIFCAFVLKDRLVPRGIQGDELNITNHCIYPPNTGYEGADNNGKACSAKLLLQ